MGKFTYKMMKRYPIQIILLVPLFALLMVICQQGVSSAQEFSYYTDIQTSGSNVPEETVFQIEHLDLKVLESYSCTLESMTDKLFQPITERYICNFTQSIWQPPKIS
jgi:hypothetical protein